MKLEKFKETDKKKIGIIVFTISCVLLIAGVFLYKTFALFEVKDNLNLIEGNVQDPGDLYFTFYVNDQIRATMPSKESGYFYDGTKSSCTNGATPEFNVEDWSIKVKNFTQSRTKCTLYFRSAYQESLLNGTDPVVTGSLIPVTIEPDGTVKKADPTSKWYSYKEKQWANAIILNDESVRYQNGEVIPESNIESYFVWIPRYKYKLWNLGNYDSLTSIDLNQAHSIEIQFGTETTVDSDIECVTPNKSGESGKCSIGKYMTHPAFTSFNSNGMWIGKFEAGYRGINSTNEAEIVNVDSSKIIIKPNTYSLHGSRGVAYSFLGAFNYKRDLDSHLLKNTEWGAIAYLTHSKYGINGDIRINNNSNYMTGYSSVLNLNCGPFSTNLCNTVSNTAEVTQPYNTDIGYLASTTGNISGIYDLSGGVAESVMGVLLKDNQPTTGEDSNSNSGFNGPYSYVDGIKTDGIDFPDKKYIDYYEYNRSVTNYNIRILGDATGEMGPFGGESQYRKRNSWYSSFTDIVQFDNSWFLRGGFYNWGKDAGIYQTGTSNGDGGSIRVVLTP